MDPSTAPSITDFLGYLGQLGVGGTIAGIMLFVYRKDVRSYTDLWQAQAALNAEQTKAMMALVEKTAGAITANTEVVKSMHRRLDRLDVLKLVEDPTYGIGREPDEERRRSAR